jgi:hypothetical protein
MAKCEWLPAGHTRDRAESLLQPGLYPVPTPSGDAGVDDGWKRENRENAPTTYPEQTNP